MSTVSGIPDQYCDTNAICTNIVGSFTCACYVGYTGDGVNCTGRMWLLSDCLTIPALREGERP